MKKIFLFLLLFTGMVKAQIVTIPDANFKAKLLAATTIPINGIYIAKDLSGNPIKIDANNDGEIQNSEALAVSYSDVSSSKISDLTGISSFTNLTSLNCSSNQLTSLDVTSLVNLTYLNCYYNQITSLDVMSLVNLTRLDCSVNKLTSLDVLPLVNLTSFNCGYNQLTSLDVMPLVNLTFLGCYSNQLTSLDVTLLVNLTDLRCSENQITTLDVTPLVNLTNFECRSNLLTSLDVMPLVKLTRLDCINNQLTSLVVTGIAKLTSLYCYTNQLTSLDLTGLVNLSYLDCNTNQLTSLDLTTQINLTFLNCSSNNLTKLFIKNTKLSGVFSFNNNQNLQYICVNEKQLDYVKSLIDLYGYINCQVNTYCSFVQGGAYNTIKGNYKLDSDNNGCDPNDVSTTFLKIKIKINDGTTDALTFVNAASEYHFYTGAGSFTISPQFENSTYFTFSPAEAVVIFPTVTSETKLQDFCITPNGVHPDLEVVLAPINRARPGFEATYRLVYKNKGNQTQSGTVNLTFDDAVLDLVTANPAITSQITDNLSWDFIDLKPFESRAIELTLKVNSPQETPAVNIGDRLSFTALINPVTGDEQPVDNSFALRQLVVGSLDPNEISCLEGAVVAPSEIGKYLHYAINFENTGTYEAENIVVKYVVDPEKYDINSLQLLDASDAVYTRIKGNTVEFIFSNIKLKARGHGNILLKIKSNNTLTPADTVLQDAGIYFDYNFPVDTGFASTSFQNLSNSVFKVDNSIVIYPNPAVSKVSISSNSNLKAIQLYDAQGRILQSLMLNDNKATLDISEKPIGIYFLKIQSEKGSKLEKIIKN